MITWITPAGQLGIITERITLEIPLSATSDVGAVTYTLIAGNLPRGLRLDNGVIKGSPTEVRRYTVNRFVIRASDGVDLEDRTFNIDVDGSDIPGWVTREGFLEVGGNNVYFVLDNSYVNFQLEAYDTDEIAGDTLEYRLNPMAGELPPGLTLGIDGVISGYTDPIFALEYTGAPYGGYDIDPMDVVPLDFADAEANGFDSYFYDLPTYDYFEPARVPRRLSRIYTFSVQVSDGLNSVSRLFKIFVITDDFLKADNTIVQVDTNLFRAGNTGDRVPYWITPSDLGRVRANNYVTIFLDVYDPPELPGILSYFLVEPTLDWEGQADYALDALVIYQGSNYICIEAHRSTSTFDSSKWASYGIPTGLSLDNTTGELAGRIPYQSAVTKTYRWTMVAVDYPPGLVNNIYSFKGPWSSTTTYQVNDTVLYDTSYFVCVTANRGRYPNEINVDYWDQATGSREKTFKLDVIGEIESSINWITPSDRGTIKPNQPSQIYVEAESLIYGGRVSYEFVSGRLPPGLEFLPNGIIQGKVNQFADATSLGLTRFYDKVDSATVDSTPSREFNTTFDGATTSFDKKFTFTIKARDYANAAELNRTFYITVVADNTKTFANLYLTALQSKAKRLEWYNFITDVNIFTPDDLYRYGDPNYATQTDLKVLVYAGIESVAAVKYVQAMSRNHYRKRILFGDVKIAKAKDATTQNTIYEVVYVDIVDDKETPAGKSISSTVNLRDDINSKVLVSYDAIHVDSDIPFVSDSDYQRVFPNSIKNMRNRIADVGERDREFLPLWMRSIQDVAQYELGYTKALILCYAKPGRGAEIAARIKAKTYYASRESWNTVDSYLLGDTVIYKGQYYTATSNNTNKDPEVETNFWIKNFDFKNIDFVADRYVIDILDGHIENHYLAFPQRAILNKYPDTASQAI